MCMALLGYNLSQSTTWNKYSKVLACAQCEFSLKCFAIYDFLPFPKCS